jgi:hypothetical protein
MMSITSKFCSSTHIQIISEIVNHTCMHHFRAEWNSQVIGQAEQIYQICVLAW